MCSIFMSRGFSCGMIYVFLVAVLSKLYFCYYKRVLPSIVPPNWALYRIVKLLMSIYYFILKYLFISPYNECGGKYSNTHTTERRWTSEDTQWEPGISLRLSGRARCLSLQIMSPAFCGLRLLLTTSQRFTFLCNSFLTNSPRFPRHLVIHLHIVFLPPTISGPVSISMLPLA